MFFLKNNTSLPYIYTYFNIYTENSRNINLQKVCSNRDKNIINKIVIINWYDGALTNFSFILVLFTNNNTITINRQI